MRRMKFDHVKAADLGHFGGLDELQQHLVHIGAVHFLGHSVLRCPWNGRGAHHRPVAMRQGRVAVLPAHLGRPFAPRMADLAADFGLRFGMDEIDNPLPTRFMLGGIQAGASGRDAAMGGHAGHLGIDQPRAPLGAFGVVDEMPIARHAIHRLILRHG